MEKISFVDLFPTKFSMFAKQIFCGQKRGKKYMTELSKTRAIRLIKNAKLFFEEVKDPRDENRVLYELPGLLNLHVAAMSCGKRALQHIENFGKDLSKKAFRILGFRKMLKKSKDGPSDTTYYDLFSAMKPRGFRKALQEQVKRDLESKAITNDLFSGGVLTLDGKGAGSAMGEAPNSQCRQSVCDSKGTEFWDLFVMRAVLTSSLARPCIDQEVIDGRSGEATAFEPVLRRIAKAFPRLFQYITVDAGESSAHNARVCLELKKDYLFAIKGNFPKLFPLCQKLLKDAKVAAFTEEREQGFLVRREIRVVQTTGEIEFPGAAQICGVRHIKTSTDGTQTTEDRVFLTSATSQRLEPAALLKLVRLHWGIENNANWTADMIFQEDTKSSCKVGNGIIVLSWLRMLSYNLVAVFRAHLKNNGNRPQCWARAIELIYQAFICLDFLTDYCIEKA